MLAQANQSTQGVLILITVIIIVVNLKAGSLLPAFFSLKVR